MLFPLERLLDGRGSPLSIGLNTKIGEALKLMVENDYSQIPIVDKNGNLSGIISEQTIIRNYYHLKGNVSLLDLTVDHCLTRPVTLTPEIDVFESLDALKKVYAIVIIKDRKPIGILTDYDTTRFFRDLSEDLILVKDIEVTLRQHIEAVFPDEKSMMAALMRAFGYDRRDTNRPAQEYDKLSFSQHVQLIVTDDNWPKFKEIFEPKDLFTKLMEKVGGIRNQLAHFRGRLDPVQHDALHRALDWLATRPKVDLPQEIELQVITSNPVIETLKKFNGKYEALRYWLEEQEQDDKTDVRVTFQDIETLIKEPLPLSARGHRSWWANDSVSHPQSKAWLQAGWWVEDVDLSSEEVIFHRSNARLYQLFFADLLERLKSTRPGITNAKKTQQQPFWWFDAGKTGFNFAWIFSKNGLRTELGINIPNNRDATKKAFDALCKQQVAIEDEFGQSLVWERLEGKESRISLIRQAVVNDPPAELEQTKLWAITSIIKFVDVFQERIKKL